MSSYDAISRRYGREDQPDGFAVLLRLLRMIAAVAGVIAIVLGIYYVVRLLGIVQSALISPAATSPLIAQWAEQLGGRELDLVVDTAVFPLALVLAFVLVGGGTALLAWLSIGLAVAGARILSWTVTDRAAMQRILSHSFGAGRPDPRSQPDAHNG